MTAVPGRRLHPGSWWLWALGLATAASRTTNPLLLLLIIAVASLVVAVHRSDTVWGQGFRYYLWAGLFVVVLRIPFGSCSAASCPGRVLFTLPEVTLPAWMAGVTLGGPVSVESLVGALYDGLRLAAMLICVGAANALADAKRLLRSVPRALHDLGAALVVAVGFAPQLVESARRVRRAQRLRGHTGGGRHLVRRTLMPVLEGATTRALVLAGSMEARGYGREAAPGRRRAFTTGPGAGRVGGHRGGYVRVDGRHRPEAARGPRFAGRSRRGHSRLRHSRTGGRSHCLPTRPLGGP